jgi:hypothetical protein
MSLSDAVDTLRSIVGSLFALGVKAAMPVACAGFLVMVFGIQTYDSVLAGDYVEAAIGAGILLAFGAGALWLVYSRVDLDVTLPPVGTPSES